MLFSLEVDPARTIAGRHRLRAQALILAR